MNRRVHIVATGARTPVGLTVESSAAAVRGGIARLAAHPSILDGAGEPLIGALDAKLEPGIPARSRLGPLVAAALQETIGKLGRAQTAIPLPSPLPVLLALPETRPGFSAEDANAVISKIASHPMLLRERVPIELQVEVVGRGHAGVLRAIEVAAERLAGMRRELLLVAGVDSYFDVETLNWLDKNRQILRQGIRGGFHPGEAAGVLALADDAGRRSWALPMLATICGAATSQEKRLIRGDIEVLGEGLSRAIVGATAGLRLPEEAVDAVYCDLNGERYRTDEWCFAALREQRVMRDTACEMPSDCWGDVGAASAALSVVLAVQGWARGYARGPRALVWASSEGGLRGAAVVAAAETES